MKTFVLHCRLTHFLSPLCCDIVCIVSFFSSPIPGPWVTWWRWPPRTPRARTATAWVMVRNLKRQLLDKYEDLQNICIQRHNENAVPDGICFSGMFMVWSSILDCCQHVRHGTLPKIFSKSVLWPLQFNSVLSSGMTPSNMGAPMNNGGVQVLFLSYCKTKLLSFRTSNSPEQASWH